MRTRCGCDVCFIDNNCVVGSINDRILDGRSSSVRIHPGINRNIIDAVPISHGLNVVVINDLLRAHDDLGSLANAVK